MRRPTTLTILPSILTTTRIFQPHIPMVFRSVLFLAIPLTTAITVIMGIGVTAGTTELTRLRPTTQAHSL